MNRNEAKLLGLGVSKKEISYAAGGGGGEVYTPLRPAGTEITAVHRQ